VEPIQAKVQQDVELQELVRKILEDEAVGPWRYHYGLLYFKDRIYLKANSPLTEATLAEFHNNTHEGYHKGLQRIKSVFYWQHMIQHLRDFIKHCDVCQRHKADNTKPAGLLQPLPMPTQIWTDISMDFVDGLPFSLGKTTILVVVDRLSKYGTILKPIVRRKLLTARLKCTSVALQVPILRSGVIGYRGWSFVTITVSILPLNGPPLNSFMAVLPLPSYLMFLEAPKMLLWKKPC
jgi:hypothetical protein